MKDFFLRNGPTNLSFLVCRAANGHYKQYPHNTLFGEEYQSSRTNYSFWRR